MNEQKIIVEIDRDGRITADADGFAGDACLKDLEKLLEGLGSLPESTTRKSETYKAGVVTTRSQTLGRKS